MKVSTRGRIWLVVAASALLVVTTGCNKVKGRVAWKDANTLYKAERFAPAIKKYHEALEYDPSLTNLYLAIGYSYMAQFQPASRAEKDRILADEAIEAFKMYAKHHPEDDRGTDSLERMYLAAERYDQAITHFEKKIERQGEDLDTVTRLALVYEKRKDADDFGDGLHWRQRQVELSSNPKDKAEALYTIGYACWDRSYNYPRLTEEERTEVIETGLSALFRAHELQPDYVPAVAYINLLYREKAKHSADPDDAQEYLSKADEFRFKAQEMLKRQKEAEKAGKAGEAPPKMPGDGGVETFEPDDGAPLEPAEGEASGADENSEDEGGDGDADASA